MGKLKTWQRWILGMWELLKESGESADEPEGRDSKTKEFLGVRKGLGGEVACGGAYDSILEKASSFEVCLDVDDVI